MQQSSEDKLARENKHLKTDLAETKKQLEEKTTKVKELESKIASLEESLKKTQHSLEGRIKHEETLKENWRKAEEDLRVKKSALRREEENLKALRLKETGPNGGPGVFW